MRLFYLKALDEKMKDHRDVADRLLIFLAQLNKSLPQDNQLADTEVECLADALAKVVTSVTEKKMVTGKRRGKKEKV